MSATSVTSSSGARERASSRIPRTVPTVTPPRYGRSAPSASLRLAVIWGISGRMARDRMQNVWHWAADVVQTLMASGEHDRLMGMMAPMDAALNAWKAPLPLDTAHRNSAKADTSEDTAEVEYHLNPCRETARALVKASAAERLHAEQREAALIAEWEL